MAPGRMNADGPRDMKECIRQLSDLRSVTHDASLERCISYLEQLKARVEMIRRLSKELLK